MRNRAAAWVNLVFASIIVIGVFVQAYLIASYAMGAGAAYIAYRDMRWLGLRGTPPGEPAVATRTADPV